MTPIHMVNPKVRADLLLFEGPDEDAALRAAWRALDTCVDSYGADVRAYWEVVISEIVRIAALWAKADQESAARRAEEARRLLATCGVKGCAQEATQPDPFGGRDVCAYHRIQFLARLGVI